MPDTVTPERIAAALAALRRHGVLLTGPEIKVAIAAADAACWQPIATRPRDGVIDVWFPAGGICVAFHAKAADPADAGGTHWALPRPAPPA